VLSGVRSLPTKSADHGSAEENAYRDDCFGGCRDRSMSRYNDPGPIIRIGRECLRTCLSVLWPNSSDCLGMDQLALRINRSGVAASVNAHSSWRSMADQAISDYHRNPKPIAVVGHSIGGDSAVQFALALGAARVPVSLLITYDATRAARRRISGVDIVEKVLDRLPDQREEHDRR
jgi:hypothetical protein